MLTPLRLALNYTLPSTFTDDLTVYETISKIVYQCNALLEEVNRIDTSLDSAEKQIAQIATQITAINASLNSLSDTVSGHTQSISAIQEDLNGIHNTIGIIQGLINNLEDTVSGHTQSISAIQADLNGIHNTISSIQTSITSIENEITDITGDIASLEADTTKNTNDISALTLKVNSLSPFTPYNAGLLSSEYFTSAGYFVNSNGVSVILNIAKELPVNQEIDLGSMNTAKISELLTFFGYDSTTTARIVGSNYSVPVYISNSAAQADGHLYYNGGDVTYTSAVPIGTGSIYIKLPI